MNSLAFHKYWNIFCIPLSDVTLPLDMLTGALIKRYLKQPCPCYIRYFSLSDKIFGFNVNEICMRFLNPLWIDDVYKEWFTKIERIMKTKFFDLKFFYSSVYLFHNYITNIDRKTKTMPNKEYHQLNHFWSSRAHSDTLHYALYHSNQIFPLQIILLWNCLKMCSKIMILKHTNMKWFQK